MSVKYASNYDLTIPFSDVCAQIHVQTGTPESYTIPGASTIRYAARFSYGATSNVFVRLNTAAGVPAGGAVTTEPYNELNPGHDRSQRYVSGGDVIHFATPDTDAYASVSLRQLP